MADLLVALVHHPVLDKQGDVVTSAVTPIDVSDIARSCRTFGVAGLYVVTPIPAMRTLVRRLLAHWDSPEQREYNATRSEALALVRPVPDLEALAIDVEERHGSLPRYFSTSARAAAPGEPAMASFTEMQEKIRPDGPPWVMMLGTGSGLAPAALARAEARVEPIAGTGDYNHLSVRAAAAILLDRLRRPR